MGRKVMEKTEREKEWVGRDWRKQREKEWGWRRQKREKESEGGGKWKREVFWEL